MGCDDERGQAADFEAALTPGFELAVLPGVREMVAPEETAETFEGNARIKAEAYSLAVLARGERGRLVLADDSGLEVDGLHGAPGVRSARWAEDEGFVTPGSKDDQNNALLVSRLLAEPAAARSARYRAVLALARDGVVVAVASGTVEGEVLVAPRGAGGFGYDPHFLIPEEMKTMAELEMEVRMRYSHRARALGELLFRLAGQLDEILR